MKQWIPFLTGLISMAVLLGGCGRAESEKPVVYSNLTEQSIRLDLETLMHMAGIADRKRAVFFDRVDRYNEAAGPSSLTKGFSPIENRQEIPQMEPESGRGYDSRMTAFSLAEDCLLEIPEQRVFLEDPLMAEELQALAADPSVDFSLHAFQGFYSAAAAEPELSREQKSKIWLADWESRGIVFRENPNLSLISVVRYLPEAGILYTDYAALLFPTPDGDLWLLEKPSFGAAYQLTAFSAQDQLCTYLLRLYGETAQRDGVWIFRDDRMLKLP